MAPKVGSIVLATDQGLGYLAKDFFDNGVIDYVLIREHSSRVNHREWYPEDRVVNSLSELIEKCDTLLFFEEVFFWEAIPRAREAGKKTVLMPMYECTRSPMPYEPDLILAPSVLDLDYYKEKNVELVTVPVDVKPRLRQKAHVFVHNAGNGGLGGRNGTKELIEAMKFVQKPVKLIIRSQVPIPAVTDPRIEVRVGQVPAEELWREGDVFIFPEKFNGLSLPLQEAFAAGMLVMCGARFPMTWWLPQEPMIPVQGYRNERLAVEFKCAEYSPLSIARKIDEWYGRDITNFSIAGMAWGEENSWSKLKGRYEKLLLP